jgi:tRNA A-37 threonylcarbamoyl transferase component Bud32
LDTTTDPRGDPAPEKPNAQEQFAARRAYYEALLGGAIGGRYQLERLVDFGAMGAVFAARHKSEQKVAYAIKILDPQLSQRDRRYVQRFVREARILEDVDHPNIVKVFEHGRYEPPGADEALYYYVMELIEGEDGGPVTLHRYARMRQLRMQDVVYLTSQILSGLRHVHERGVVHRDLKPWNVLIDRNGVCKIVDFGLAKIPDSNLTDVDELFGSQEYIAPELYYRGAREATPTSDIFAVGRIFADLVDQVDFSTTRAGVFASKAAALKYLDALLKRLVEEDPKLRFGDAEKVLAVLDEFQSSTQIRATVGSAVRMDKAQVIAAAARRRWISTIARWLFDYALFIVGIAILPLVWAKSPAVSALLAGSLVTSKLWSALSHPPDRHPIAIVVKALAGRLNRVMKEGDFHVLYYAPHAFSLSARAAYRPRHVSEGHRRQYRTLAFPEGAGVVGLAARARSSVILHSVPRWGSDAFRALFEKHLRMREGLWKLFDPTRRAFFCVPVFRIVKARGGVELKVAGVLSVNTRIPDAVLRSEVTRAIREYAAVVQDVIEPVHGSSVREIIAGGAAPLETILVNGMEPRVPPIESRSTFAPGSGGSG